PRGLPPRTPLPQAQRDLLYDPGALHPGLLVRDLHRGSEARRGGPPAPPEDRAAQVSPLLRDVGIQVLHERPSIVARASDRRRDRLELEEILNDLGARRDSWGGYGLHILFDNIRVPFTSVGFQYNVQHGRWYGPGNGNQYSTTP